MTDADQAIVNRYAYDPYGRILGKEETIVQPFTYVGQFGVMTEADGLYYMRARYYDAQVGRSISEDPIGFLDGVNLYAYVGGNPIMLVDPNGEFAWFATNAAGAIFGAISGGIGAYVSSGGKFKDALIGAGIGAAAGLISPASAIGNATLGFGSSLAGQAIGARSVRNLDYGLAAASAVGGVAGRGATKYLANSRRSSSAYVIARGLGAGRPAALKGTSATVEGFVGGTVEAGYQALK